MSGIVYIYHAQCERLLSDTETRIRELNIDFHGPLPGRSKTKKTRARVEDITLAVPSATLEQDLFSWTAFDLDIAPLDLSGRLPLHQADPSEVTLPALEQWNLQFDVEREDSFHYDLEPLPSSPIARNDPNDTFDQEPSLILPDSFDYEVPPFTDVSVLVEEPSFVGFPSIDEEMLLEDQAFFAETRPIVSRHVPAPTDRRISLTGREIRQDIDTSDYLTTQRPTLPVPEAPSVRELFYNPSLPLCHELKDMWDYLAFQLPLDDAADEWNVDEPILEQLVASFSPPLPVEEEEEVDFPLSLAAERLREGLRKASVASTGPVRADMSPILFESPSGSRNSVARGSSPLPQRRASSFLPQTSDFQEPSFYDASVDLQDLALEPSVYSVSRGLTSSITEDSARMLQQVQSHLDSSGAADFSEVTSGMGRRAAAKSFFQLLVLGSTSYLDPLQTEAYGPITIRAGDTLLQEGL